VSAISTRLKVALVNIDDFEKKSDPLCLITLNVVLKLTFFCFANRYEY